MIGRIKNYIKSLHKEFSLKKTLICCSLLLVSLSVLFPAGCYSSNVKIDACATYFSEISKNHAIKRGDKNLSGLLVEPKNGGTDKMRKDTDNAITELWGVFKGQNATFAPVINANRENDIHFVDKEFSNECLPIVYTDVGQSTEVYHTKNGVPVDYKFQSSPLALMFPSLNSGMHSSLHIYISQAQAERKLRAHNMEITKENLQSLQKTKTQMEINGVVYNCTIDNIYLDNFSHNYKFSDYDYYYGTDIGAVLGDFVFIILYAVWPKDAPPEDSIKRQSLYIMSEYTYRNRYFFEYAKESYSPEKFLFKYCTANLEDSFIPEDSILQGALFPNRGTALCIIFSILSVALLIGSVVLIYLFKLFKQPLSIACILGTSFAPYLVFKLIYLSTKNGLFFSPYALIFEFVILIILYLSIFIFNCFGRKINVELVNDE